MQEYSKKSLITKNCVKFVQNRPKQGFQSVRSTNDQWVFMPKSWLKIGVICLKVSDIEIHNKAGSCLFLSFIA